MLVRKFILAAISASFVLGALTVNVQAQDNGALLDLLVKKRILTDQEAEEIRGELTKDYSTTSAGKLKM